MRSFLQDEYPSTILQLLFLVLWRDWRRCGKWICCLLFWLIPLLVKIFLLPIFLQSSNTSWVPFSVANGLHCGFSSTSVQIFIRRRPANMASQNCFRVLKCRSHRSLLYWSYKDKYKLRSQKKSSVACHQILFSKCEGMNYWQNWKGTEPTLCGWTPKIKPPNVSREVYFL